MEADEKIVIETYEKMICTRREYQKLKRLACNNILKRIYEGKVKSLKPPRSYKYFEQFSIHSTVWHIFIWYYNSTIYVAPADGRLPSWRRSLVSLKPDFVFTCFLYLLIESCYAIYN